ncbi:MAG: GNAT family N-acetyltransferase, partial [Alphaproteobacteria bacterium]|nr:GNAT family N-acetyltransferase [Alphaproteobacteria bacterium]
LENKARISLRAAARTDSDTLLAWQQAPGVRRYAHNPEPPSAEEHRAWFLAQRCAPDSRLFIITYDESPAGMIRLDQGESSNSLVVSILVAEKYQKYGVGVSALSMAHGMWPAATFLASVLPGNEASHRLFRTAGYAPEDGLHYNYARRPHDGSEQRAQQ